MASCWLRLCSNGLSIYYFYGSQKDSYTALTEKSNIRTGFSFWFSLALLTIDIPVKKNCSTGNRLIVRELLLLFLIVRDKNNTSNKQTTKIPIQDLQVIIYETITAIPLMDLIFRGPCKVKPSLRCSSSGLYECLHLQWRSCFVHSEGYICESLHVVKFTHTHSDDHMCDCLHEVKSFLHAFLSELGQQDLWAAYIDTVNISTGLAREKKSRTWKWWWRQEIFELLFNILTVNQASELPYRHHFLLSDSVRIYILQLSMLISSFGSYLFSVLVTNLNSYPS